MSKKKSPVQQLLLAYDLTRLLSQSRALTRRFTLHIGPTNSGKTYDAIQALKSAHTGVYLGPLRLLALEMFDTLNAGGCPCSLLTGEEYEYVEGARHTASTIELCDFEREYDVAVIDEAQLIADPSRGSNWTKAILCVKAKEVHVCMAPEAEELICRLLKSAGIPYDIKRHSRLVPLKFSGVLKDITQVEPGDALILFSRKNVLAVAAELEGRGVKASVIYGALPPAARREEVRRFAQHETSVVVATDAIGMGISLPIKRVIFCESRKYDGTITRELKDTEIAQIAGRAGRYGMYNEGEALTMSNANLIREGLRSKPKNLKRVSVPFPEEALDSNFTLRELLIAWPELPRDNVFRRADVSEAYSLLSYLPHQISSRESESPAMKRLIYKFISCPVDSKNASLIQYWISCCLAILKQEELPMPHFDDGSLNGCEVQYKAFDIRHQLLRRIGIEEPHLREKADLCEKINKMLAESKGEYGKKCSHCGKKLPYDHPYGMCEECYQKMYSHHSYWDDYDEDEEDDEDEGEDEDADEDYLYDFDGCDLYSLNKGTWVCPPAEFERPCMDGLSIKEQYCKDLEWFAKMCARPIFFELLYIAGKELQTEHICVLRHDRSERWDRSGKIVDTGKLFSKTDLWSNYMGNYTGSWEPSFVSGRGKNYTKQENSYEEILLEYISDIQKDVTTAYCNKYGEDFFSDLDQYTYRKDDGTVEIEACEIADQFYGFCEFEDFVTNLLPMFTVDTTIGKVMTLCEQYKDVPYDFPVFTL